MGIANRMIPTRRKPPQTGGVLLSGMAAHDKQEQTRRAAEATDASKSAEVEPADARLQHAAHLRASRAATARRAEAKAKGPANKGRDARAVREAGGANADRGNQDLEIDVDPDKEEDEEEESSKTQDLFWKHLVWGAYGSRKRRGEE